MKAFEFQKVTHAWKGIFQEESTFLVQLDSVAGDGDIGLVMSDGFAKVDEVIAASNTSDLGKLIYQTGKTLASDAPSSMGTLLANGFMRAGKALRGHTDFTVEDMADMMQAIADGIMEMGGAHEGEKTALDSLLPGIRAMRAQIGTAEADVLKAGWEAAKDGFENTRTMVAKHGRIAVRGEGSRTIADPGAAVVALLFKGIYTGLET